MLVVTESICGFVVNQVQYDMESAQYLGYDNDKYILDIYIYLMPLNLVCDPCVSWSFYKIKYIYI